MNDQLTPKTNGTDAATAPYKPVSSPPRAFRRGRRLGCSTDVYEALADIREADREHFVVFDLDVRHRIIARRVVHIGTLTGVDVHPREIFRQAILNSSCSLILAHNHPSTDPSPSAQDLELTARLRDAAEILGIRILDHVIVAADGFVSLADRGWV